MAVTLSRSKLILFPEYRSCCKQSSLLAPSSKILTSFTNVTAICLFLRPNHMLPQDFLYGANRFYHKISYPLTRSMSRKLTVRALSSSTKWWNPPKHFTLGSLIPRLQRIPYSGRFHIVLSHEVEKKIFEHASIEGQTKFLPKSDPRAIRVESIGGKMIQAMNKGLMLDKDYKINGRAYERASFCEGGTKYVRKLIWKPATEHLNGENWEIYVHDSDDGDAICIPSKNMIVFCQGVLDHLSDTEIAAIMGHEIGHSIARHQAETIHLALTFSPLLQLGKLILNFYCRRMEAEADYMGLILMACAGYDPRVAPELISKFAGSDNHDPIHPSGVDRARLFKKAKVMEEAVEIYKEVQSGNGVRSFI